MSDTYDLKCSCSPLMISKKRGNVKYQSETHVRQCGNEHKTLLPLLNDRTFGCFKGWWRTFATSCRYQDQSNNFWVVFNSNSIQAKSRLFRAEEVRVLTTTNTGCTTRMIIPLKKNLSGDSIISSDIVKVSRRFIIPRMTDQSLKLRRSFNSLRNRHAKILNRELSLASQECMII